MGLCSNILQYGFVTRGDELKVCVKPISSLPAPWQVKAGDAWEPPDQLQSQTVGYVKGQACMRRLRESIHSGLPKKGVRSRKCDILDT